MPRVELPLFEIVSTPTIRLSEIRERRFDLVERAQQAADGRIHDAILGQFSAEDEANLLDAIDAGWRYVPTWWERLLDSVDSEPVLAVSQVR